MSVKMGRMSGEEIAKVQAEAKAGATVEALAAKFERSEASIQRVIGLAPLAPAAATPTPAAPAVTAPTAPPAATEAPKKRGRPPGQKNAPKAPAQPQLPLEPAGPGKQEDESTHQPAAPVPAATMKAGEWTLNPETGSPVAVAKQAVTGTSKLDFLRYQVLKAKLNLAEAGYDPDTL